MEREEFYEEMLEKSSKLNINLTVEQLNKFYKYMEMLITWNEKINLTAIIEPHEIILKHFIDSLTLDKYLKNNENLVDVGTGAGFPGIPISIVRKDIKITLVDSLNKRLNFLNEVIKELKLENVETVHSRAENLGQDIKYREKFDISTSRAVANLSTLSEYLIPLVKVNGQAICMKAGDAQEEIKNAQNAIKTLGGQVNKIEEFCLPDSDINRTIIIIEKKCSTKKCYPRKAGIPSKEPIK